MFDDHLWGRGGGGVHRNHVLIDGWILYSGLDGSVGTSSVTGHEIPMCRNARSAE